MKNHFKITLKRTVKKLVEICVEIKQQLLSKKTILSKHNMYCGSFITLALPQT